MPSADQAADPLGAGLAEPDPVRAEALLGQLVNAQVEPLVFRIVSSRLRRHSSAHHGQIEDVSSEAVVSFLLHVEELRAGRAAPVANLDAFVAALAARACNDYFRRAYPAFHSLRNKLRYLLGRYPDLARWKDQGSGIWLCGLVAWQSPGKTARPLIADVERIEGLHDALSAQHPADQLSEVFLRMNAPIPFNDLAHLMARLWNVQESGAEDLEDRQAVDAGQPLDVTTAQKQWLTVLWQYVGDLNRNQRMALLLNLKGPGGCCGASLLVTTGVATIRQIARAIDLPDEEFAGLWERLPLNDQEVADLLALTRQQVINLRKCARAKLTRQMQTLDRDNGNLAGNLATNSKRSR